METNALKKSESIRVEALYRKYGTVIYSRCRWFLKDDALAEDATQDIFVRLISHLESAPDDGTAIWWIYRVTANRCFTLLRARRSHAQPVANLPEMVGLHPESALIDRELAIQVMNHAPAKLRNAAALYYLEGVEQSRIAAILGVSKRTVINRLNDFVIRSRKFLARDGVSLAA